ncbi:MAG: lipoprotein-releasing system ATP-binding protein [Kosmotogales bacterium]|nr:lipoprotein-releasing system ATP-binding protein [Kosmotogales bacterium]
MNSILKCENIKFSYGKTEVLSDLNFSVNTPSITGIKGPSGSGKTTLFGILSGLLNPDAGKVYLNEIDIYKNYKNKILARKKIGLVFQNYNLIRELTVFQNIQIVEDLVRNNRFKIEEILEKMNISDLKSRYPDQLSIGQRQRVAIARALCGNPSVILADEPTGSVDPSNKKNILELFLHIKKVGIPVIISSHDQTTFEFCDKVFSINEKLLMEEYT